MQTSSMRKQTSLAGGDGGTQAMIRSLVSQSLPSSSPKSNCTTEGVSSVPHPLESRLLVYRSQQLEELVAICRRSSPDYSSPQSLKLANYACSQHRPWQGFGNIPQTLSEVQTLKTKLGTGSPAAWKMTDLTSPAKPSFCAEPQAGKVPNLPRIHCKNPETLHPMPAFDPHLILSIAESRRMPSGAVVLIRFGCARYMFQKPRL